MNPHPPSRSLFYNWHNACVYISHVYLLKDTHTLSHTHTRSTSCLCTWRLNSALVESTPARQRRVTYIHAALGQSAMKAFPFVINRSLSEEQSLGDSNTLTPHHNSSPCKTNERRSNCRQTKITFPIKVLVSLGSQKPSAPLNCLTALIYPSHQPSYREAAWEGLREHKQSSSNVDRLRV